MKYLEEEKQECETCESLYTKHLKADLAVETDKEAKLIQKINTKARLEEQNKFFSNEYLVMEKRLLK